MSNQKSTIAAAEALRIVARQVREASRGPWTWEGFASNLAGHLEYAVDELTQSAASAAGGGGDVVVEPTTSGSRVSGGIAVQLGDPAVSEPTSPQATPTADAGASEGMWIGLSPRFDTTSNAQPASVKISVWLPLNRDLGNGVYAVRASGEVGELVKRLQYVDEVMYREAAAALVRLEGELQHARKMIEAEMAVSERAVKAREAAEAKLVSAVRAWIEAAREAALRGELPNGYQWGRDAMDNFTFGKMRAAASIDALDPATILASLSTSPGKQEGGR